MRRALRILCIVIATLPLGGCWDRREVNELALVMAKGVDLTDDNHVRVTVQVALPSQVGGSQSGSGKGESGKSFFLVSATGRTVSEADWHIQQKLPREMYLPHLRILLIGERMAENGMEDVLDHFGRNPPNRLRTTILVAKHSDAAPLLQSTYPLESLSGEAVRKLERQLTGSNKTLMDFLIEAAGEGIDQSASAVELIPQEESERTSDEDSDIFRFSSTGIFRDLKLIGYVQGPETVALQWLNQRLRRTTLTCPVPNMHGTISVELTQARRRAYTYVHGNDVTVKYVLLGTAMLTENETGLDADNPKTVQRFQIGLNKYVESIMLKCLEQVNRDMNADPTGIGQLVYHQHPYLWPKLKPMWRQTLPHIHYIIDSRVQIIEGGKSGPPLYGKPQHGIRSSQGNTTDSLEGDTDD